MLSASTTPDLIEEALRRGASAYVLKTVDPSDLPSTLRQVIGGTVFSTVGRHRELDPERREGRRAHRSRGRDPHRARERQVERRDREGAVGHAADGEVPPHQRLPQARRQEPRGRRPSGLPARSDPAAPRRRLTLRALVRGRGRPEVETCPVRHAPLACATRITAPTIVVGTNQTACMQIANASPASRPMPKSASADTPSHWYVPTNPGEEGIATPRLSAAVTKIASTTESSTPTARPTRIAATAQVDQAATLIPNQTRPRSAESGSAKALERVAQEPAREPAMHAPRPRPATRVRARGRQGGPRAPRARGRSRRRSCRPSPGR